MLQVGFPIQALGFNIANALMSRGVKQNQVSGKLLILEYLKYATHLDLAPWCQLELTQLGIAFHCYLTVLLIIRDVTLVIFEDILNHRNEDDKK